MMGEVWEGDWYTPDYPQ